MTASGHAAGSDRPTARRPTREIAVALFGVQLTLLLLLGPVVRPHGTPLGAESDGHIERTATVMQGGLPTDPYRPLLFPLVAGALGSLLGWTPSEAARAVSAISAALLTAGTFVLAQLLFDALLLNLLLAGVAATTPSLLAYSFLATTDVMGAALATWTLCAAVNAQRRATPLSAALLGATFAAAFFVRYQSVALLPAALLALGSAEAPRPARLALAAIALGAALLCLAPHFALTYAAYGSFHHSENYKNLALKLYGDRDWTYLQRVPFESTFAVVAHSPMHLMRSAVEQLSRFLFLIYSSMLGPLGLILGGSAFLQAFRLVGSAWQRPGALHVPWVFGLTHVAMVCTLFIVLERLMIALIAPSLVLGAALMLRLDERDRPGQKLPRWLVAVLALTMAANLTMATLKLSSLRAADHGGIARTR